MMKTLSGEQFEDMLRGCPEPSGDLDEATLAKLDSHRAVRDRLKKAGKSIETPDGLADRLSTKIRDAANSAAPRMSIFMRIINNRVAAAAIMIFTVGLFFMFAGTTTVQAEISEIHFNNTIAANRIVMTDKSACLCKRLQGKCTQCVMLKLEGDCAYIGTTLTKLRKKDVAAVLVEVDGQRVSIISVQDRIDSLEFKHKFSRNKRQWCNCSWENV